MILMCLSEVFSLFMNRKRKITNISNCQMWKHRKRVNETESWQSHSLRLALCSEYVARGQKEREQRTHTRGWEGSRDGYSNECERLCDRGLRNEGFG